VTWGAYALLFGKQSERGSSSTSNELEPSPIFSEMENTAPEHSTSPDSPLVDYVVAQSLTTKSSNAVLIRVDDGSVLYEKNCSGVIFPASLTKIMTAIVALNNLNDLYSTIMLDEHVFSSLQGSNLSVAGFIAGEEVRAIDLLYGLLLPSGAECGIGLAQYIAGSESSFVDLMNSMALELGMNDTHFTNTSGVHDADHYSTVSDIAILLRYAISNETFLQIFTSANHSSPPTNKHPNGLSFSSTLFSNVESATVDGVSILGGKTGFTSEAGRCLASLAEVNGEWFILITAGARSETQTQNTGRRRGASEAPGAPGAPGELPREPQGEVADVNYSVQNLHIDDAFAVYSAITVVG